MTMTKEEFRNEYLYNATMAHVKSLLRNGLVTEDEYWKINTTFKEKYQPVSDGLMSEKELICAGKRAKMVCDETEVMGLWHRSRCKACPKHRMDCQGHQRGKRNA